MKLFQALLHFRNGCLSICYLPIIDKGGTHARTERILIRIKASRTMYR